MHGIMFLIRILMGLRNKTYQLWNMFYDLKAACYDIDT